MSIEPGYDVVLADPAWEYYGSKDKWAAAGKHYDLMSNEEIWSLPIADLLTDRGVLFLWATCPRLDYAMTAIQRWGLHFRGVPFVWVKTKQDGTPIGAQGVRPSIVKPLTEIVLAASKVKLGRPIPIQDEGVVQTIFAPRREHSRKPDEVKQRIVELYGDVRRIELFARASTHGWDTAYSEEVSMFDPVQEIASG